MRNTNRTLAHQTQLQAEQRIWERREALYKKMLRSIDTFMKKATDTSFPTPEQGIMTFEGFFESQFRPQDEQELQAIGDEIRVIASDEVCRLWDSWAQAANTLAYTSMMARFNNPTLSDDGSVSTTKEVHREQINCAHEIVDKLTQQARFDLLYGTRTRRLWHA
jgi:hypothetical protein